MLNDKQLDEITDVIAEGSDSFILSIADEKGARSCVNGRPNEILSLICVLIIEISKKTKMPVLQVAADIAEALEKIEVKKQKTN